VDIPALGENAQPSGDEALGADHSVNVRMRAALSLPFGTPMGGNPMLVSYTCRQPAAPGESGPAGDRLKRIMGL
jgi:hypothetical protein